MGSACADLPFPQAAEASDPIAKRLGKQLPARFLVHRQDYDVHCFATDLDPEAAAIECYRSRRRPIAAIPAGNESPSVAHANDRGAFLESRDDSDAIGAGELFRPNAVPG